MRFASPALRQNAAIAIVVLALAAIIGVTHDRYTLLILSLTPIWAIMGLSWDVLGGYLGLISFGQAAFFGLGAYTVVILANYAVTPWIGLPLAGLVGAVSGVLVGAVTFRFRGFYFALAMLAFPLATLYVFDWAGWNEVALPIHRENPWAFMQFDDPRLFALIALLIFALAIYVSLRIERSRFGLLLFAIRQDELAAGTAGISAFRQKLKAIAYSGTLAGLAGGLYALAILVVTPASVFGMLVSAQALIISMFGGRGTAWGAAIGAAILIPLSEFLHGKLGSALPGIAGVVFGAAIMLVVILIPQGVYWLVADRLGMKRPAPLTPMSVREAPAAQVPIAVAPTAPPLLAVEALTIAFGGVTALQDVSFNVRSGELIGIIGPNGAGKTTLFNVLGGLLSATSGRATFGDRPLFGLRPDEICALGIGRTFQTVRSFPRLTLLENVVTGAFVRYRRDDDALAAAWRVLGEVGLSDRAMASASELTNRELRLMELARALSADPKLILLDECLAGLSTQDIDEMIEVLRRLCQRGVTIAIIEHTIHAMVRLAQRLIVLDHGTVIAAGEPANVLKNKEVISAYLGRRWAQYAEG